jgi:amino-acid N-acetyltransferase
MSTGILKPTLEMGKEIHKLINYYAHSTDSGILSRPLKNIYENIRDFIDRVLGCVCLHIYWDNLAEIRSLAVWPEYAHKGIGRSLIESVEKDALELKIAQLFTLTKSPEFFKKMGYNQIEQNLLPKGAAWGECMNCPKYPNCDEIALIKNIF